MSQSSSSSQKIKFPCPSCGREFTWKPEIAGKRAKCKCGNVLTVPKQKPKSAPPPPPPPDALDEFDLAGDDAGGGAAVDAGGDDAFPGDAGMDDDVVTPPPVPSPMAGAKIPKPSVGKAALKMGAASVGVPGADDDTWKWWYYVLAGLAMVPIAFIQYFRLLDYEKGEESRLELKSFERFLYGIFGKWGVCGFLILIGAVCISIGLYKYKKQKEAA